MTDENYDDDVDKSPAKSQLENVGLVQTIPEQQSMEADRPYEEERALENPANWPESLREDLFCPTSNFLKRKQAENYSALNSTLQELAKTVSISNKLASTTNNVTKDMMTGASAYLNFQSLTQDSQSGIGKRPWTPNSGLKKTQTQSD